MQSGGLRSMEPAFRGKVEMLLDDRGLQERVARIETLLGEIETLKDPNARQKAAEMAQTLDFDQRVDSSVLDSFRVRIYGETAVVWFSRHMTGPKSGKIVSVTYRFVDVFVKRAGRWQCVSSQSTRVGQ